MFTGNAAFPRLASRLRWTTRLRGRALVLYLGFRTALMFAFLQWVVPPLRAAGTAVESAKEQLRAELGREPTETEVRERAAKELRPHILVPIPGGGSSPG